MATIKRIEFLGFTVAGPRSSVRQNYKASEWPRWTAKAEGQAVLLEGEGRRLEVPRNRCLIEWEIPRAPAGAEAWTDDHGVTSAVLPRRRGRPPKVVAPTEPEAA